MQSIFSILMIILFFITIHAIGIQSFLLQTPGLKLKSSFKQIFSIVKDYQQKANIALVDEQVSEYNIVTLIRDGPIPLEKREFLINGWRWHTRSVIRDLNRYYDVIQAIKISKKIDNKHISIVKQCYDFVLGFNYKALCKVESEIFFPWLQELLPQVANALFINISNKQKEIKVLSQRADDLCNKLIVDVIDSENDLKVSKSLLSNLYTLEEIILDISNSAQEIQYIQEKIFVPYIAAYVDKSQQERFNRQVISRLGLLDSQVHLVSMAEAIKDDPREWDFFQKQIPQVARVLIPIWKTRLYQPKTQCLDVNSISQVSS